MKNLLQDTRYAVRTLSKSPGFTAAAVGMLALGIGANTAIFTVVNSVLLRPLPYPEAYQLVLLSERTRELPSIMVSYPDYLDWRNQNSVFEDIAVFNRFVRLNLTGRERPERLAAGLASANLFDVLGLRPALGRGFRPEDDRAGSERTVVLTDGLWKRRFGADPSVVGQSLTLHRIPHTVVGVLPPAARFGGVDLWVALGPTIDADMRNRNNHNGILGIGRLKRGVSFERARADMETIARRLEAQYPDSNAGQGINLRPLETAVVGGIRPALLLLSAAVGLVLLIACANVANLLAARAAARAREVAIRQALGAGRGRLVRQFLTESAVLALAAGALGLLLASWSVDLLVRARPAALPRLSEIELDGGVLAFTLGLSVLTALIFGLLPALRASRRAPILALKEATAGSPVRRRWHGSLVIGEVALALVLLTGAGLLLKSLRLLATVDPGFDPRGTAVARIDLPEAKYARPEAVLAFYSALLERARSLPGVRAAGLTSYLPLSEDGNQTSALVEGRGDPPNQLPLVDFTAVSGDYFRAMEIALVRGRPFGSADTGAGTSAALINETAARRFWPGTDPIGKRVKANGTGLEDPWLTVVGVVRDVRKDSLASESRPEIYVPHARAPRRAMSVVLRTGGEVAGLPSALRAAVADVDPDQPISRVATLEAFVADSLAAPRFSATLLGLFAALALALAVLGLASVLSYSVTQRTREIGIRIALGARRVDVLALVVGHALLLVGVGVALGIPAAAAATRLLSSALFEVSATDPGTFVLVSGLLVAVSGLAALLPAWRAVRVDPLLALRQE